MKIVSTLTPERSKSTRPDRARAENTESSRTTSPIRGDRVQVSRVAMQLAEEVSQVEDPRSTSNISRVEELRRQIEDGIYDVDPERIADAILEEEL